MSFPKMGSAHNPNFHNSDFMESGGSRPQLFALLFAQYQFYFHFTSELFRKLFAKGRFIKGNVKGNKDAIIRTVLLIVLLIGPGGPKNSPLVSNVRRIIIQQIRNNEFIKLHCREKLRRDCEVLIIFFRILTVASYFCFLKDKPPFQSEQLVNNKNSWTRMLSSLPLKLPVEKFFELFNQLKRTTFKFQGDS